MRQFWKVVLTLVTIAQLLAASISTSSCKTIVTDDNQAVYYCGFQVCGGLDVSVSSCVSDGGSCSGNVSLTIYNSIGNLQSITSESCGGCPRVSFQSTSIGCSWYNVYQVCVTGICNVSAVILNGTVDSIMTQKFALKSLPLTIGNQDLYTFLRWNILSDLSRWTGVVTDASGNVQGLYLADYFASGYLSCSFLSNVPYIEYLVLENNLLQGTIPQCIIECTNLVELDMLSNKLTGTIPELPSSIQYFDVGSNSIDGTIPPFTSSLTFWGGDFNMLTGSVPVFQPWTSLVKISVLNNLLTGTIPDLFPNIQSIALSNNQLSGTLPVLNMSASYLQKVELSFNRLSGSVPALPSLLEKLHIDRMQLSGQIPALPELLLEFVADENNFSGTIPAIPSLMDTFTISDNNVEGQLPSFLNTNVLSVLDVSDNSRLSGTLPSQFCSISTLKIVIALGCNFTCYEACSPNSAYYDYLAVYTMLDPDTVPNYDVCWNDEVTALCEVAESLQFSTNAMLQTEYLAETLSLEGDITVTGLEYSFSDFSSTFSRFDITFDSRSLESYGVTVFVTICPSGCDDTTCTEYTSETSGFPGIGLVPSYTTTCNDLDVKMLAFGPGTETSVFFRVDRYSYENAWVCSDANETVNPCTWLGISCYQNVFVNEIQLSGKFLTGEISPFIGSFSYLKTLDLSSNSISGSIPTTIGLLSMLQNLDVSNNAIIDIPTELGELSSLVTLNLNANSLKGSIPTAIMQLTQLQTLQIRSNYFDGKVPTEICQLSNAIIAAQGNPLACYEGCNGFSNLSGLSITLDEHVGYCAPTSTPTSAPSAPTPSPTSVASSSNSSLNVGIIVGTVVAFAVLALALPFIYRWRMLEVRFANLPLHKMLYNHKIIDESHIERYEFALNAVDKQGLSLLEFYYSSNDAYLDYITKEALIRIIENALQYNIESGGMIASAAEADDQNYAWSIIVQREDDKSYDVCVHILDHYEGRVEVLAHSLDQLGRRCIDVASGRVRDEMNKCMYLFRRFELYPGPAEHKSATSLVVYAVDHGNETLDISITDNHVTADADIGDNQDNNDEFERNGKYSRKVALKFMKNRAQYLSEIEIRNRAQFDEMYVISVLEHFDGDAASGESNKFREAAKKRGFADYPYCVVMDLAESSLKKVIDQQHIAGEDWDTIKYLTKSLCYCLSHIHSKNVIHGDLKPSNMVLVGNAIRLIDLDASCRFGSDSADYAACKYSSAYLPPELFYHVTSSIGHDIYDVKACIMDESTGLPIASTGYELMKPSTAQDMWSVGVILYLMCSKQTLFQTSLEGNIAKADMSDVYYWTNELKEEKLSIVEDKYARNLLSLLLSKQPENRPDADHVLSHPFITGIYPSRLQGEEPEFDIFLSYRVASDSNHVSIIYDKLTALGLKVWWDKKCLLPGQPWEEGFCNGLASSSCFVCLLSRDAIFHCERANQNFSKLERSSRCDNVLLEWRLAHELRARKMIEGIFPILIGNTSTDTTGKVIYSNYFSTGCHPTQLPALAVASVESKLKEHLDKQGLGTPLKSDMTVQEIVADILANQGGFVRGDLDESLNTICTDIMQMRKSVVHIRESIEADNQQRATIRGSRRKLLHARESYDKSFGAELAGDDSAVLTQLQEENDKLKQNLESIMQQWKSEVGDLQSKFQNDKLEYTQEIRRLQLLAESQGI